TSMKKIILKKETDADWPLPKGQWTNVDKKIYLQDPHYKFVICKDVPPIADCLNDSVTTILAECGGKSGPSVWELYAKDVFGEDFDFDIVKIGSDYYYQEQTIENYVSYLGKYDKIKLHFLLRCGFAKEVEVEP